MTEQTDILLKRVNNVSEKAKNILGIAGMLDFASFSKDAIQAALPDVNIKNSINELLDYGLLKSASERLIFSHEQIHNYARNNHKPDNEIVEKLAGYYSEIDPESYGLIDIERVHIFRIMEECKEREIWQKVIDLVWMVQSYFNICGYWTDKIETYKLGITAAQKLEDKYNESAYSGNLGTAYRALGEIKKAIGYYKQALTINREMKYQHLKGYCLGCLGLAYYSLNEKKKAIVYYKQALTINRVMGYQQEEGNFLFYLGIAYFEMNKKDKARKYFEESLSIYEAIKSPYADKYAKVWLNKI